MNLAALELQLARDLADLRHHVDRHARELEGLKRAAAECSTCPARCGFADLVGRVAANTSVRQRIEFAVAAGLGIALGAGIKGVLPHVIRALGI
jgi:hypothetical protein